MQFKSSGTFLGGGRGNLSLSMHASATKLLAEFSVEYKQAPCECPLLIQGAYTSMDFHFCDLGSICFLSFVYNLGEETALEYNKVNIHALL